MTHDEVVRKAKEQGVKLVFFVYCDNSNLIRGKAAHITKLPSRLNSGVGLTVGQQAVADMETFADIPGMGTAGEARIVADPATYRQMPWSPSRGIIIGDLLNLDGTPWACPRTFLKQQIARAEKMDLRMMVGLEPEFYVAKKDGDYYTPLEDSHSFHLTGAIYYVDFIDEVIATMEQMGLEVETYYNETGPGHLEIALRYADALQAADNHIYYREAVRNVAFKHGLYASFAAKPFPAEAGAGCHIHLSAWDKAAKKNLFYQSNTPYALSELGWQFLAGVMEHMPGLMPLMCPTVNSYRRLVAGSWAGSHLCYGPDNRAASIRIPSLFKGNEMNSANLEVKIPDNSSNPYLAIGGILAAGLDGIERKLKPNPKQNIDTDPNDLTPEEMAERGIARLPYDLEDAIEELEKDSYLVDALGPVLGESFIKVRKVEWEHFRKRDELFELQRHFNKY
ncbi:MAG: glutamine synthetase family protein [Chloroflexi bacterium]|nr:glutamine synthetase family protein [Chloroflexota bacterium]